MPDFPLTSAPPLAGTNITIGDAALTAPADLAVVSVALPLGNETAAEKAIKTAYGAALPDIGKSTMSKDGAARLVRLGRDQAFVIFTHDTPDAEPTVQARLRVCATAVAAGPIRLRGGPSAVAHEPSRCLTQNLPVKAG